MTDEENIEQVEEAVVKTPKMKSSKGWFSGICGTCTKKIENQEYSGTLNCPHCNKLVIGTKIG